ncbi:uncharacterized protein LOC131639728 [Vicia villosa]|uniref:uncharacterized protein LOC131639728 n=1 Tax=Vicia villosa TaxID=3911 RepID=UPI00273CC448|nr:uncharacterized protein LOC131639728 [Vicia villosa]
MVAKQGWFLMNNPQVLVSRIFKARYFSRTSFLDVTLGYNPSFVWKSVWKEREVLKLGYRWSIGDGNSIKVMSDSWLRGSRDGFLNGPKKQVFKDILQFPLVEGVEDDRLVWKEEQKGSYSVRSGYRIWGKAHNKYGVRNDNMKWKSLWRISALTRVKHLIWRICRGCLSSKDTSSLIFYLCCKEDCKIVGRVELMMECLWKNINDLVWHNEKEEASKLDWLAFQKWQEWFSAQRYNDSDLNQLASTN